MKMGKFQKIFGVGPLGFTIVLFVLGILLLLDGIVFRHLEILRKPGLLRLTGAVLLAVWVCWHFWCVRTIRRWWTGGQLCTRGPFRFVRHPMYAGGVLLFGVGVALMFNSWILLLWPAISFPVWSFLVRREEAMMAAVFGDEYNRYASQTGRLFPRLRR
jgi:protein-S-isoprenylcysteine O-methyltransferase Ste14